MCLLCISNSYTKINIRIKFNTCWYVVHIFQDSEGIVQIFVWVTFLNVLIGFIIAAAICFECVMKENECILGDMDWLSASILLILIVIYLFCKFHILLQYQDCIMLSKSRIIHSEAFLFFAVSHFIYVIGLEFLGIISPDVMQRCGPRTR